MALIRFQDDHVGSVYRIEDGVLCFEFAINFLIIATNLKHIICESST